MINHSLIRKILLGLMIILTLSSFTKTQEEVKDANPTGFSKDGLDQFLNGILSGSMIGIDMDDFPEKDIDYENLSEKVENLIENYKSEDQTDVQDFLKGLADILDLLDTQSELNELEGPTVDLLAKFSVPILASGEFVFTYRTSLIIHEASVSEYFYRGEKVDFSTLGKFGERLGNLAAKVYYDGKYDFDALFPIAFPNNENNNTRQLGESKPSFQKKDYSMFNGKSIFEIRKTFFGMDNPNHLKDKKLGEKLGIKIIEEDKSSLRYLDSASDKDYDFRTAWPKCVMPVRNQGSCGSCWAQAAAGIIEKRVCRLTDSEINIRMSPQRLVNCSSQDKGCQGGTLYGAYNHLMSNGITTEACTPYTGKDDTCRTSCKDNSELKLTKTVNGSLTLIRNDVQKIKNAIINQGPVENTFVKIYQDFLSYGSGIYKSDQNKFMGYHAMQIIGWGEGYWIVENSWGNRWGENGHVRIAFGEVGVSDYVIFAIPEVKKPEINCPDNCKVCIKEGICQPEGCSPGFRNVDGKCVACPKNCKECLSDTCGDNQCNDKFRNVNGQCVPCEKNCMKCSEKGCEKCIDNLIPNNEGKCVPCPQNCKVCTSVNCPENQCNDGFANSSAGQCVPCKANCEKCSIKGCLNCKEGFIPNPNGVCEKCPENCASCKSTQCPANECKDGFKNVAGKCVPCETSCEKCSDKGCSVCKQGFKNISGKCQPCSENCLKCSEKGCTECKKGFENQQGKCVHVKCPEGCEKCQGNVCSSCIDGFSLIDNQKCVKCPVHCDKCDAKGNCLACDKPLHLVNGKCEKCPANCKNCVNGKCEDCAAGLVRNGKGECSKCDENCRYCHKTRGCLRCNYGFWNNKGSCTKCEDNCRWCGPRGCYRCNYGFWNNRGKCQKCMENCRYCRGDRCYLCEKGFAKVNGQCKKCPENCNRCNSKGCYHWGCALGFGYDNGQCKKCDDNCSVCSSRWGCRRCKAGFHLDKNRKCVKCKEPCLACSATRCYKCPPGYKRSRNGCYKCPENCRACNHRGCYSWGCNKGFGITRDYQCQKCPANCNKCNGDGCFKYSCFRGYGNNMQRPRECVKCTENCAFCRQDRCLRCNYKFSLTTDRKQCVNCGDNCALCSNNGQCRRCVWKFWANNGKCESCPANCLYCRSGRCYWCARGYRRDRRSGQCVRR